MPLGGSELHLQPTPLFGRDAELSLAVRLLSRDTVRLLTLTGPVGVGKSRLARAVVEQTLDQFSDAPDIVDLAEVAAEERLMAVLTRRIGMEAWWRDPKADRPHLVLLDNFEHLVEEAETIATLLSSAAHVKFLITSRTPLRLRWEHLLEIAMLPWAPAPDASEMPGAAVQLYLARARAAGFEATPEDVHAVSSLCARLDGLPLAIELAAARATVLPPRALLGRLSERLDLLVSRDQDAPPRHRTLRDAIGPSYGLLPATHQRLLQRLSLFSAGFTVDAAMAMLKRPEADEAAVFDQIAALAHCRLVERVQRADTQPRFRVLESIRAYSLEQLSQSGGLVDARKTWLEYLEQHVDRARELLSSANASPIALDALEEEHDNLRAALRDCIETGQVATGLKLACAWSRFWLRRGYFVEGRGWFAELLRAAPPDLDLGLRARSLSAAGSLAYHHGDTAAADAFETQALAIWRNLRDTRELAASLDTLGHLAHRRGDIRQATDLFEESLNLTSALDDEWSVADTLQTSGDVALEQGHLEHAVSRYAASLRRWSALGDLSRVATVLQQLATVSASRGQAARAMRLIGAATAQREIASGRHMAVVTQLSAQRSVEAATRLLAPGVAGVCMREGLAMTPDEAVAFALDDTAEAPSSGAASGRSPLDAALETLTPREREVANLLVRGITNRQIGAELEITERTAETHVCRILAKLKLDSRAQFARLLATEDTPAADAAQSS
jgi:predicted ATPase/DNA-binding NarL/FixJ family response regulator